MYTPKRLNLISGVTCREDVCPLDMLHLNTINNPTCFHLSQQPLPSIILTHRLYDDIPLRRVNQIDDILVTLPQITRLTLVDLIKFF